MYQLPKSQLAQDEITYLGYRINQHDCKPADHLIKAIVFSPKPTTVEQLRHFLDLINYYRPCLSNAPAVQAPINELLKGSKKEERQSNNYMDSTSRASFSSSEATIISTSRVTLSPRAPLSLVTDVSHSTVGSILEQLEDIV